ncbi:MAG: LCP family protein [Spirochaetales bacterium]|nr:LCP family protein [Spirochaetales bacterium]
MTKKAHKGKTPQKKSRPFPWAVLLTGLWVLGFGALFLSFLSLKTGMENRDALYAKEWDDQGQALERIRQNLFVLRRDSEEVREHLNLPRLSYPSLEEPGQGEEGEANPASLFFNAVTLLVENRQARIREEGFTAFLDSPEFKALLGETNLTIGRTGQGAELRSPRGREYALEPRGESGGNLTVRSRAGEEQGFSTVRELRSFITFQGENNDRWYRGEAAARDALTRLDQEERIASQVRAKDLSWTPLEETETALRRRLSAPGGLPVLEAAYDKDAGLYSLRLSGGPPGETGDLYEFREMAVRGAAAYQGNSEKAAEEASLAYIRELAGDPGFAAFLAGQELSLDLSGRQDEFYDYFDLRGAGGEKLGSLAVQRHSGDIYIMDGDDVQISSFRTLGFSQSSLFDGEEKKNSSLTDPVPEGVTAPPRKTGINFVLIGANERNTDTIMLICLRPNSSRGTIITIPRDLYYHGRKINSLYPRFGPESFKAALQDITGQAITRFVYIDMFAFADVVDLIGGIDLVLAKPLIDPTYRVRNNGVWGTLYYPAGPVHLGGIEALRVARSRNTSSDFDRAARQQQILLAIKDKIFAANLGDVRRLLDLIKVLSSYVETDFSALEMLNLYLMYRDVDWTTTVLSGQNVLYNSYSNTYFLEPGEEDNLDEADKGAWILLPRDNDWTLIPRFINGLLGNP